jgi:hypothetical protein
MLRSQFRLAACVLALGAGCLAGCSTPTSVGSVDEPAASRTLRELGELLRTFPPGSHPNQLQDIAPLENRFPQVYEAVKSGDIVVVWGGSMKGEGESLKGGGDVIAYEKDTPTSGGYVLLTSGEVKKLDAAEFASAPKAR